MGGSTDAGVKPNATSPDAAFLTGSQAWKRRSVSAWNLRLPAPSAHPPVRVLLAPMASNASPTKSTRTDGCIFANEDPFWRNSCKTIFVAISYYIVLFSRTQNLHSIREPQSDVLFKFIVDESIEC